MNALPKLQQRDMDDLRAALAARVRSSLSLLNCALPDPILPKVPDPDLRYAVIGSGPLFFFEQHRFGGPDSVQADADELNFLICDAVTFALARDACDHMPGTLTRPQRMDAHIRLMARLLPGWGTRVKLRYERITDKFPLTPEEKAAFTPLDLSAFGVRFLHD